MKALYQTEHKSYHGLDNQLKYIRQFNTKAVFAKLYLFRVHFYLLNRV